MKKLYFGSNLKMYKTIEETELYLKELAEKTSDINREEVELFIIPSYTALDEASKTVEPKDILLGAQNMCWEDQGQFTGEISPLMLEEIGIRLVMIGHSERRHLFRETDIEENKKVLAALKHGFTTLLCVGETGEEKEYGVSAEVLRKQLIVGLHGVPLKNVSNIWVAYEPVWSIGVNGIPAQPEYAEKMHKVIHDCLEEIVGKQSKKIPVLYGGSVNPSNADELIVQEHIDGLFVGRAAWQAEKFNVLIRQALNAYNNNKEKR
jgi:triosephosphate isomerase